MRESAFTAGQTYIVPIMIAHADVRMLPFVPERATAEDPTQIVGTVTLPDGTHAEAVVPLHTLRRD